jgi:hypothetical protein
MERGSGFSVFKCALSTIESNERTEKNQTGARSGIASTLCGKPRRRSSSSGG